MTEFEINKAVAKKAGLRHSVNELVGVVSADKYRGCYFDPCNEPLQAWEIMMKYNICVTKTSMIMRHPRIYELTTTGSLTPVL